MDWDPPPEEATWVLDDVFDRQQGWYIPEDEASVQRKRAPDGTPRYEVTVGRIVITIFEQHVWKPGHENYPSPGRLCAMVKYTGVSISKPDLLLVASYEARGVPSFGLDPSDRQPTLHTAFPIAPGFPVDLARRQLMVCMGMLAIYGEQTLAEWNTRRTKSKAGNESFDWEFAGNVAGVAAKFLRGLVGP